MDRNNRKDYSAGYGEEDRDLRGNLHKHANLGRTSFDRDNAEYDQPGGRNEGRNRDAYSNHTRSDAGDRYRDDRDDRFDGRNQYGSSRNYGGMGGFGGAQGFGTSRAGQHHDQNRDHDHYDFTSGRKRPDEENDDHGPNRAIYGGYRGPERYNQYEREQRGYIQNRPGDNRDNRNRGNNLSRSGFANTGENPDQFRDSDRISRGEFSGMLGGGESRGWYHPSEGGYTREGGYVSGRQQGFRNRRAHTDEENDPNYGQTFGNDIRYDPTSRDPRDTRVQNEDVRSRAKYGSETRDLNQVRNWQYDRRLDERYGRSGKHVDWD